MPEARVGRRPAGCTPELVRAGRQGSASVMPSRSDAGSTSTGYEMNDGPSASSSATTMCGGGAENNSAVITCFFRGLLDGNRLVDSQVIWRQEPKAIGRGHFGHRIVFGRRNDVRHVRRPHALRSGAGSLLQPVRRQARCASRHLEPRPSQDPLGARPPRDRPVVGRLDGPLGGDDLSPRRQSISLATGSRTSAPHPGVKLLARDPDTHKPWHRHARARRAYDSLP